jgi:hypothetical protein
MDQTLLILQKDRRRLIHPKDQTLPRLLKDRRRRILPMDQTLPTRQTDQTLLRDLLDQVRDFWDQTDLKLLIHLRDRRLPIHQMVQRLPIHRMDRIHLKDLRRLILCCLVPQDPTLPILLMDQTRLILPMDQTRLILCCRVL